MEREILKKGSSLLCKRIIVRCKFIHQQKKAYPIKSLWKVMEVSRSRFYQYLKSTKRRFLNGDLILQHHVKILSRQSKQSYGSRKMSIALKQIGYQVGRYKASYIDEKRWCFLYSKETF
jgi:putative transposase